MTESGLRSVKVAAGYISYKLQSISGKFQNNASNEFQAMVDFFASDL